MSMSGTILALFGTALAVGLSELLLPPQSSEGTVRLFRFLTSLVILIVILTPFLGFLQSGEEIFRGELDLSAPTPPDYEQAFSDAVQAQSEADFKAGLSLLLEQEYGIQKENATLLVRFDTDGTLSHVSVFLSGAALLQNPDTLAKNLSIRLGCAVEVR